MYHRSDTRHGNVPITLFGYTIEALKDMFCQDSGKLGERLSIGILDMDSNQNFAHRGGAMRFEHDAFDLSITVGDIHESPDFGRHHSANRREPNKRPSGSCLRDPVVTPQVKQMEVGHRFVRTCPHRGSRETCG